MRGHGNVIQRPTHLSPMMDLSPIMDSQCRFTFPELVDRSCRIERANPDGMWPTQLGRCLRRAPGSDDVLRSVTPY